LLVVIKNRQTRFSVWKGVFVIIVRDIFQLHFGKAREAIALLKEMREFERARGYPVSRLLADVTGTYYTLVSESQFEKLGELETALAEISKDKQWRDNYERFIPLVREGRREVFRVIE
jgi:hypothetical protein